MKFNITNPYIVAIEIPEGFDQRNRTNWLDIRMDWLEANISHPYDCFFIRNAVEITSVMIQKKEHKGDWFGELWMFHFQDPHDATLFKLTWG